MRRDALKLVSLLIACIALGCQHPEYPTIPQMDRGLVWIFPGVEGGEWSMSGAKQAFRDAGCDAAFRVHDWSHPLGIIVNLVSYEKNRADAAEVARQISEYKRAFPGGPIDFVGYSGGGGMAVMVAEALPEEIRLRNVILVQPALSPDYDLTDALRQIDGKLVNFHSPYDYVFLGAGTNLLGTMDRKHTSSAGKNGFDLEAAAPDPRLRAKIEQRTWSSEMAGTGHIGMHMGILLYEWNYRYVAPYLMPGMRAEREERRRTRPSADAALSRASVKGVAKPPDDQAVKPTAPDPFYRPAPTTKPTKSGDGRPLRRMEAVSPRPASRTQDELPSGTAPNP